MKILVVSLLRLGDVIQQIPLIKGIRAKYPDADIHLLVNSQFSHVEELLQGTVDRLIRFDRASLQKGLVEPSYNFMWSYSRLDTVIRGLSSEGYDEVYNLTHTRLSGFLVGAIEAHRKLGLVHEGGKFQGLDNPWLKYFNDRFSGQGQSLFHYVELLGKAFSIPVAKHQMVTRKRHKRILLQCLTSDEKKNWGLERFAQLKGELEKELVDFEVKVLCAPFEVERLVGTFNESDLLIADLIEARQAMEAADLLVTGDTSIKHLAAQIGLPTVEIVLGGSDAVKTGAFSERAIRLESKLSCAPCIHSKPCHRASHLCAEEVTVGAVFMSVWDLLSGGQPPVISSETELNRRTWETYLDTDNQRPSLGIHFEVEPAMMAKTEELRSVLSRARRALPPRSAFESRRQLLSEDIGELVLCAQEILKSSRDQGFYFGRFIEALTGRFNRPVEVYERVTAALEEAETLIRIRENHLNSVLSSVSMEGDYYAKGIGRLSISGFEDSGKSVQRDHQDADL